MAKKTQERLTAMVTLVVTPSTNARIQAAAASRQVTRSTVIRWAVEAWLEANATPTANDDPTEVSN